MDRLNKTERPMPSVYSQRVTYDEFHLAKADLVTIAQAFYARAYGVEVGQVVVSPADPMHSDCEVTIRINVRAFFPKGAPDA